MGKCLAVFHNSLAGLSSVELAAPLQGFHDIDAYLQQYDRASDFSAMESDGDLSYCAEVVAGYRERSYRLVGAAREGIIRKRIVHGDPKIANFLLHESTAKPLALIDLDTVGPGFLLHDIGDCLRSLICSSGEGGLPGEISLQTELVGAMLRGYSRVNVLAEREKRCIFDALFILTFELGVRFLTDHRRGDSYFKVNAAGENLRRAVVQLKLAELIAGSEQELRRVSL